MKTKLKGMLTLLIAFVVHISYAQTKTISGSVSDDSGPLPGVSIQVKGTNTGTETDFDGKYSIKAKAGDTLVFSFVGMKTTEKVVGNSNSLNVVLSSDNVLDEVVVTALGIKREKKSLGYATQTVKGESISNVPVENFTNALSGEAAGIDIKASGALGGSVNIVARGNSSITATNQMLIVIDGIQVQNESPNRSGQASGGGGFDYGNAASDINPNDIESVNILKGAAASALYGSRASNGVVLITTKKGRKKKGIGITFSSSLMVGTADKSTIPEYQQEYGGGGFGVLDFQSVDLGLGDGPQAAVPFASDASWGPAFDPNRQVYHWFNIYPQLDTYGQTSAWVPGDKTPIDFFETGITNVNSISFEGANEESNFRLGYTNLTQEGVIPNSEIKRNTFSFRGSYNFTDKLTGTGGITYTRTDAVGRYGTGYDDKNVMRDFRQWWQTNLVVNRVRDAYFSTRQNITWNPNSAADLSPAFFDNPYWTRYENFSNDSRDRYLGNINLNYQVTDWFSILGRITRDAYSLNVEERTAVGSTEQASYYQRQDVSSETNYDIIGSFDYDITERINLNANLGWNLRVEKKDDLGIQTNGGLRVPGFYSIENSVNPITSAQTFPNKWTKKVDGMYGRASFGLDDTYFVEGTLRTDRSSALPVDNNRYWYYSATGSVLFSNIIKDADWLSYGKLRANYAEVGNDTGPYRINPEYIVNPAFGGAGSLTNPSALNNANLRPERTTEFEVGLEMKMFDNRLGFDVSYYDKTTDDLITNVTISSASGASSSFLNAGSIKNRGIEVFVNATPIRSEDFAWDVKLNWSKNENTVEALAPGIDYLEFSSIFGASFGAQVGESFGTIRGTDWVFDDAGNRVVNRTTGRYVTTSGQTNGSNNVLGDSNPDWLGGITNTFRYKDLSLSFLLDIRQGGSVFSLDNYFGQASGLYAQTAGLNELGNPQRDPVASGGGVILDGVVGDVTFNPDGTYVVTNTAPNTVRAAVADFGNQPYAWSRNALGASIFDASYVKLREVSLTYKFPQRFLEGTFIQNAVLSFIGRNLWIIHKNTPFADPEAGLAAGNIQGLQTSPYPSVREIGASIKLNF